MESSIYTWIKSKPEVLGSWFDVHLVQAEAPMRTNLLEISKALTLLTKENVVIRCSHGSRVWYVWKTLVDAAVGDVGDRE